MPKKKQGAQQTFSAPMSNEYCSDCSAPGMLFAVLARSPVSRGKIESVALAEEYSDCALFTARDIPGEKFLDARGERVPIFCEGNVSYLGEPIGVVVCADEERARKAAGKVKVALARETILEAMKESSREYPPFYSAVNFNAARNAGIRADDGGGKKTIAWREARYGAAAPNSKESFSKIFSDADCDLARSWEIGEEKNEWLETNCAFCFLENGAMNIFTPTQWPLVLRKAAAAALGIDESRVRVNETNSNGHSANGIWRNAVLAVQCALAASLAQKPVKLSLSREEHGKFMKSGVKTKIFCRSAVSKDGEIKAMRVKIEIDCGARNPFAQEIIDRMTIAARGAYNTKNLAISARAVTSSNPPTSIHAERVDSPAFFAIESQMQAVAEKIGISPVALRLKNMARSARDQSPPFTLKLGKARDLARVVAQSSDFDRKYVAFKLDENRSKISTGAPPLSPARGIGFACAFGGSLYLGGDIFSHPQKISITLARDGRAAIRAPLPSEAVADIWKKTAADFLQTNVTDITVESGQDEGCATPFVANVCGNISMMTQLIRQCCVEINKRRDKAVPPITARKGLSPMLKRMWSGESFSGTPFYTTSFGCAAVELEIDRCSREPRVKKIWIAVDAGKILSTQAAENAIRLAVEKELSGLVEGLSLRCDDTRVMFAQSTAAPAQIGEIARAVISPAFAAALSLALKSPCPALPVALEKIYGTGGGA